MIGSRCNLRPLAANAANNLRQKFQYPVDKYHLNQISLNPDGPVKPARKLRAIGNYHFRKQKISQNLLTHFSKPRMLQGIATKFANADGRLRR